MGTMLRAGTKDRPKHTISWKDDITVDIALRRAAESNGRTKGEVLREIVRSAILSNESGPGKPDDPLLAAVHRAHLKTHRALADGRISPVERDEITDDLAESLHLVRTRRSA